MKLIDYQYYPSLKCSYNKSINTAGDYSWYEYWICLGPLQTRWRGKSWCSHLRRSPEYLAKLKEILREELVSMNFKD